jgi:hypothetical protein
VKYDFHTVQCPLDGVPIHEVALDELDATAQPRNIFAIARAKIVEHAHSLPALYECLGKVRPDKTGAASNQLYAHRNEDNR